MSGNDRSTSPIHSDEGAASTRRLCIGKFRYNPASRRLTSDGQPVSIQRLPLSVLLYLAEHRDRVVSRDELLEAFWPRSSNDEALTRCMSTRRKILGDSGDPPSYLETVWGEGYRLLADVSWDETEVASPASSAGVVTEAVGADGIHDQVGGGTRWRPFALMLVGVLLVTLLVLIQRDPSPAKPADVSEIDFIAVLPIQGEFEEPWLASTLTEHLIQTVARIEGLAVVARVTAAQFSAESDPRDIGRRLDVDAVLVSEYTRDGEEARLYSQLLSARDGSLLWSYRASPASSESGEGQVIALADAVARHLWASLQLRPTDRDVDAVAYRHYLRGRYLWNQRSVDGLEAAILQFEQALVLEPEYVDALTGLADAWLLMPLYGATPPTEAIPEARAAAHRAVSLDPINARAQAVLGVIAMQYDWDWADAERHLRRAVTLNPNDPTAVQWLGELNCYQKRFDSCRRYYRMAEGLDPLSPIIRMVQGSPDLYSGAYAEAIAAYREVLNDLPDFKFTHLALGHALAGQHDWDAAVEAYRATMPQIGLEIAGGPLVFSLVRAGKEAEARRTMVALEAIAADRYVPPSRLAVAHLGLGDRTRALAELQRAVQAHDDRLVYLAVDPFFEELHDVPEFRDLLSTIGLEAVRTNP